MLGHIVLFDGQRHQWQEATVLALGERQFLKCRRCDGNIFENLRALFFKKVDQHIKSTDRKRMGDLLNHTFTARVRRQPLVYKSNVSRC